MSEFRSVNPTSGEQIETFAQTTEHDLDLHLDRAQACNRTWRATSLDDRAAVLRSVSKALRARCDSLARTATREMGKPVTQAAAEVEKCASACEHFAERAAGYLREHVVPSNAAKSFIAFRPLGTILAIMPWNFPYWQVFRAAAPALMAGNTMVLKHAPNVTRCALEIEKLFRESGAPDGLFTTILVGVDHIADLMSDSRIAAATLTGSPRAGMSLASVAGHALKKTVLELGGSDAFIVLADADLEAAAAVAVKARFQNNGQSCIAAKRFIVERSVYDEFTSRFARHAVAQIVGDPLDPKTELGPIARDDLRETLHRQVQDSLAAGARVVSGGKPIDGPGFFYEATVLANVTPAMPVFCEETFGPAAAMIPAEDAEHAVQLANDSQYGLGGNVWTADIERAIALASKIESGSVFINGMTASDPRLPFGGIKHSGYGRELGSFGIHEFTNVQTVWIGPAS